MKIQANNITIKDLEEKYQMVAEMIGIDKYMLLCQELGGSDLYIPTMKELQKKYIYQKIKESRNLFSKKQLAKIYGVSLSTVYKVLRNED